MSTAPTQAELLATARTILETRCAVERFRARFPVGAACSRCGATNPIVLVRRSTPLVCYACRVDHDVELDHMTGHKRGPLMPEHPNLHRLRSEVERIERKIMLPGVRTETACGLVTYVALKLYALGTIGERP